MNSVLIGTHQMDTEFGLYLPEYSIPAPVPQTKFINVIGRDGAVDLSNAFGSVHYNSREWNLDFKHFDPVNWHTISSSVFNAIHGKRLDFTFDDDPNYHWTGRFIVQDYTSKNGCGTLKVRVMADPFKYKNTQTTVSSSVPVNEQTLTGDIVTINNNKAYGVNSLGVSLSPIQDLHGYSSPWPAGGGKNKFNPTAGGTAEGTYNGITYTKNNDGSYSFSGTAMGRTWINFGDVTLPEGTWTASVTKTGSYTGNVIFGANNGAFVTYPNLTTYPRTVTSGSETTGNFSVNFANGVAISGTLTLWIQIESGSSATSWTPYSNICPITGRTGVTVYRTGSNLFPPSPTCVYGKVRDDNGDEVDSATAFYTTSFVPVKPSTKYTLKLVGQSSINSLRIYYLTAGGVWISRTSAVYSTPTSFTTPSGCGSIEIQCSITGEQNFDNFDVYLSEGSTATEEPFGSTYAFDWTSTAGTVYGGTLDVATGVLTVDRANIASYNGETITEPWLSSMDAYAAGTTPTTGAQVVYTLATPITYQLTAQEVELLTGTNNIWSEGQVSVVITEPIVINNPTIPVVPTVTASAPMTLRWNAQSYSMDAGTRVIPQLTLQTGNNPIYVDGEGTISFAFSEASL